MSTKAARRIDALPRISFPSMHKKSAMQQRRAVTWTWSAITFLEQRVLCHFPGSNPHPRYALFKLEAAMNEIAGTLDRYKDSPYEGARDEEIRNVLETTVETLGRANVSDEEVGKFQADDSDKAIDALSPGRKRDLMRRLDTMRRISNLSPEAESGVLKIEKRLLIALAKPQLNQALSSLNKRLSSLGKGQAESIGEAITELRRNWGFDNHFSVDVGGMSLEQARAHSEFLNDFFEISASRQIRKIPQDQWNHVQASLDRLSLRHVHDISKLIDSLHRKDSQIAEKRKSVRSCKKEAEEAEKINKVQETKECKDADEVQETEDAKDDKEIKALELLKYARELREVGGADHDRNEWTTPKSRKMATKVSVDATQIYGESTGLYKPNEMLEFFPSKALSLLSPEARKTYILKTLSNIKEQQAELSTLEKQRAQLDRDISKLRADQNFIENLRQVRS